MKKITTKLVLTGLMLGLSGGLTFAQNGLECIVVEKYYVANAADVAGSVGTLAPNSVTYRVYADMLPGYKFQALYGVPTHSMTIQSTTCFFNNEDRGATTPSFSKNQAAGNTIMLDSWFSVGGACNNAMGILKSEDDGVANVVNSDGILQNTSPMAGIPLTTQDGFTTGTPLSVTFVGLSTELNVFDATSCVGNSFTTTNGSVACLTGAMGPVPATNKVLIGQFTTDGIFSFELNVQIGTPSGGAENYVANNPTGNEITLPCLTYSSATSVGIKEPAKAEPSVSLYPNPANDFVNVDVVSYGKGDNSYKIINVLGEVVKQSELVGATSKIEVSSLPNGMYFIEFNVDTVKMVKKIIKR